MEGVVAFSFFVFSVFLFLEAVGPTQKIWLGLPQPKAGCSWTELEVQKCRIEQSGQVAASKSAMAGC
jgi:hypothetical protein